MNRYGIKRKQFSSIAGNARAMRASSGRAALVGAARSFGRRKSISTKAFRSAAGEKKGMDTVLGPTNIVDTVTSNVNATCLNLIQQGAGSWNRVGRKVINKSLRIKGDVIFTQAPTATGIVESNSVRMVVVWDKQPNGGAIPNFNTIFGVTSQDGTETCIYKDPPKYDNMDRFSVLRDCVMDFAPPLYNAGAGSEGFTQLSRSFDEFIPLKGREVVFLGQSNPMTIADVSTGAVYVYFRAKYAVNAENDFTISGPSFARLRYIDP